MKKNSHLAMLYIMFRQPVMKKKPSTAQQSQHTQPLLVHESHDSWAFEKTLLTCVLKKF